MTYQAAENRYDSIPYRRVGRSGLVLPALSLGLWHNFGDSTPIDTQRALLRTAFDLGINHFDLANNYGPPYGSAEINFGRLLREDFKQYRDELIISSKAGWDMWPGPYGQGGGSRKYVLASLDQSLQRLGLDYVDIFYSHRFDPDTRWKKPPAPWPAPCSRARRCISDFVVFRGENPRDRRAAQGMEGSAVDSPAGLQPAQSLGGKGPAGHRRRAG
ncbi:aldo/keto reductase [Pseudomonas sp. PCH446]